MALVGAVLLTTVPAAAWLSAASHQPVVVVARGRRAADLRLDAQWRPKTVDPLGKAFGFGKDQERSYAIWLDLRTSEVTFAQQVLLQLFYGVRRVVDEAGRALPKGAKVEGLLFDEMRYDRADAIGSDVPFFVETASGGMTNVTVKAEASPVDAVLRAPTNAEELVAAQAELEEIAAAGDGTQAPILALPADAMLWAVALTGLKPDDLVCLEGNEGA